MLKILVVEDHALVREGLVRLLAQIEAGVVLRDRADFESALSSSKARTKSTRAARSGLARHRRLRRSRHPAPRFPAIPVVVVSAFDDLPTVTRVMNLGASGFIPESLFRRTALLAALRQVLAGDIFRPRGACRGAQLDDAVPLPPFRQRGAGCSLPKLA